ncbi:thioredoxin-dependent thiol peroxidase [Nitratifractor sp.]
MPNVGEKAPDFCLPNQDNEEVCLRDLQGSWVVLYFYPKDNTPGCTTEALDFTAHLEDFRSLGATVLGVSPDSVRKHQNFIAKKELKITLLSDEEKEVCQAYGVWQLKKNYGREYMGVVRSTFLIDPDGLIREKWEKVRVKGHVEEVLQRLKELVQS